MLLEFAENGHPTFRATTPLSRGTLKSKGHGKLSTHFTADDPAIELSINGAVTNICQEFEAHKDRSGDSDVLMGQSIVLGEIEAEILLQKDPHIIKFNGTVCGTN